MLAERRQTMYAYQFIEMKSMHSALYCRIKNPSMHEEGKSITGVAPTQFTHKNCKAFKDNTGGNRDLGDPLF